MTDRERNDLRYMFAGMALQGMVSQEIPLNEKALVQVAVQRADALIVELERTANNKDENDWETWEGDDCPVEGDTLVDIKCRDGRQMRECKARELRWDHWPSPSDIVAWRESR